MQTPNLSSASSRFMTRPKSAINIARKGMCTPTPKKSEITDAAPLPASSAMDSKFGDSRSNSPNKVELTSPEKYNWKPLNTNPGPG